MGRNLKPFYGKTIPEELPETQIIDYFVKQNISNVEVFAKKGNGYSIDRFPTSMVEALEYFATIMDVEISDEDKTIVFDIGKEFCNVKYDMISGATDLLSFLLQQEDKLHLYTKGDVSLQRRKIEINNLTNFFEEDNTHIVTEKPDIFPEELLQGLDKNNVYMVGNSKGSDITPALNAGIKAILIPFETWSHEKKRDEKVVGNKDYIQMNDLSEIRLQYDNL